MTEIILLGRLLEQKRVSRVEERAWARVRVGQIGFLKVRKSFRLQYGDSAFVLHIVLLIRLSQTEVIRLIPFYAWHIRFSRRMSKRKNGLDYDIQYVCPNNTNELSAKSDSQT